MVHWANFTLADETFVGEVPPKSFLVSAAWLICLLLISIFIVETISVLPSDAAKKHTSQVKKNSPATESNDDSQIQVVFRPYPPMMHPIRIGIANRAGIVHFAVWSSGALFVDDRPMFSIRPGLPYLVMGGRIVELGTNRTFVLPTDKRSVIASSDYRVWINNRWYRGVLEIVKFGRSITAIDVLDLEEYLRGVVPSEMPSSWHPEDLKAQAVAARSYAWAHIGTHSKWFQSEGYDLVPDVRDQAYKGLAAETNSTSAAVLATYGIVLKDSGRVKPGFYRAWVGDAFENLNMRKQTVSNSFLEKITGVPKIVGVTVKQWDATGNATDLQVIGQKKTREVYGIALAQMLGLTTAGILDVQPSGPNWIFTFRGPGNGSRGLSQHGANMLAECGWHFYQILQQYYQDQGGKLRLDNLDNYRPQVVAFPQIKHATSDAELEEKQDAPIQSENEGKEKGMSLDE